jgi:F-type H+-transporting ATPase subunit b
MGIPLNIDWQQILLHLFNFAILAVGLYILLYKPVKDFMDKRKEYYKELDQKANQKLDSAEKLNAEYENRMTFIDDEIAEKKTNAVKEMEVYRENEIKKAEAETEAILREARAKAEEDRNKIIESAKGEIADSVLFTAEKLIRKNIDDDCTDLFDDMLRKVGENCGE